MEQIILNLVPGGVSPVCYVSQYDVGRKIRLHLRNGSDPYVLSGAETVTATIRKVSGEELIYDIANTSASYVDLIVNYDATDVIGESVCELIITESGTRLGSANFKMRIDPDVYSGDQKLEVVSATSENPNLSFETNVEENLLELKASFSPVQDLHGYDSPWIDGDVVNKEPYNFRAISGTASRYGNSEFNKIVGGTVAFNQVISGYGSNRSTTSVDGNTVTATSNGTSYYFGATLRTGNAVAFQPIENHKYIIWYELVSVSVTNIRSLKLANGFTANSLVGSIMTYSGVGSYSGMFIGRGSTTMYLNADIINNVTSLVTDTFTFKNLNIVDLTAMFGSTIADYIYSLEQATAGAGVAWFKALFPNDYYAYNAGELISVKTSSHITRGFNQWDEEWEVGGINSSTGETAGDDNNIRSKNYIPVLPSTDYYIYDGTSSAIGIYAYDSAKNYIGTYNSGSWGTASSYAGNRVITTPSRCAFLKFATRSNYGTTYKKDICINISDLSRNGTYASYVKHTYPLDSDLELRGIPKLDENNNLYYDGDEYTSDGGVNRRYGLVDLGSLVWRKVDRSTPYNTFYCILQTSADDGNGILCPKYKTVDYATAYYGNENKVISSTNTYNNIFIVDNDYNDADSFKAAMSGVYLLYELETPTSEIADPFTNPQPVDANGSEEFVDNRSVAIPVGHESYYANICEIEGWNEVNVVRNSKNLLPLDVDNIKAINTSGTWSGNTYSFRGVEVTILVDEQNRITGFKAKGTATGGTISMVLYSTQYTDWGTGPYIINGSTGGSSSTYFWDMQAEGTGNIICFTGDVAFNPVQKYRPRLVIMSGASVDVTIKPMIRKASVTDDTYVPPQNQIINLDWNTNQWDEEWENGAFNESGQKIDSPNAIRSKNYIPVLPNTTYYYKCSRNISISPFEYNANKEFIKRSGYIVNNTFTVSENTRYIMLGMPTSYGTTYNHDISINYPSTDHTYHPYRGHGVAYNGEVVYKDGGWKLRLLSKEVDLGDLSYEYEAPSSGIYGRMVTTDLNTLIVKSEGSLTPICEKYHAYSNLSAVMNSTDGFWESAAGNISFTSAGYTDTASFKTALRGTKFVYPLAAPIEIPLDQNSKLATVLGINNLMQDANGGTEVKFFRMISASEGGDSND